MSLLVIGTIALDTVETPTERRESILGGSATFFSHSAIPFGDVRLVGVVGEDFPPEHVDALRSRGADTGGIVRVPGKTFHWAGRYIGDMNVRETTATELGVLEGWDPVVPEMFRDSDCVFLANAHPASQASALDQMTVRPRFVLLDTMNFWIDTALEPLLAVLRRVDGVVVNDEEARMLTGESNLVSAGRAMLDLGPGAVILKKGEHGALLFSRETEFAMPAYPVTSLVDPTGAGDSFAGGLLGSLAAGDEVTGESLKRGMVHGTVMASFAVESFSVDRLTSLTDQEISSRTDALIRFFSLTED